MLGVTATPLSSNVKLPMNESYDELIVGTPIAELINRGYLAKATTYSYNVRLGTLQVGINGDYTVKSSEELYSNQVMQAKLLYAYRKRALGKKTLIFNAGINTSLQVLETFKDAKLPIRHLDSHCSKNERQEILKWFKKTPDAILTSVGILTTGFDEPTIQSIILNRATRSLSLYFQMIGRGSRVLKSKKTFEVIDLGNNVARFGLWENEVNWQKIFRNPDYFLTNLISDDEIERNFKYTMPEEIRVHFAKSEVVDFDIYKEHKRIEASGQRTRVVIENSINQHVDIVMENSNDFGHALQLIRMLDADIDDRVRRYAYCISKSTRNYRDWLIDDYKKKLRQKVTNKF
jgi:type I site-specific restriction endonuclease